MPYATILYGMIARSTEGKGIMTISYRDIRYVVREALAGINADYDIDRIVEELVAMYDLTGEDPTQNIEDDDVDFWGIIIKHEMRGEQ